jgi:DNA-binding NarL/FixJ family response regulator
MNPNESSSTWRVVVVEDNHQHREFLESCVQAHPSLSLAGAFSTLATARAWFAAHEADLLLLDLGLPDGSGLTLMREVHARWPACDMLVVSMFGDEENVVASIEAGAVGYVHKDDDAADIAQTLLAVKQGASPISPMIARHLLRRMQPSPSSSPRPGAMPPASGPQGPALPMGDAAVAGEAAPVVLSRREQEVLEFIARGFSYAEIARQQGITVHTVQTYIKKLYGKLAVHSRSEAVFEAHRLGLLDTFSAPAKPDALTARR